MPQSPFSDVLSTISKSKPRPSINVGLTDGNRIRLTNWQLAEDCLVEQWPSGHPRYLVPVSQIVSVEIPDQEAD
jgi:hypothetical protein